MTTINELDKRNGKIAVYHLIRHGGEEHKMIRVLAKVTKGLSIRRYRKDLGNSTSLKSTYFKKEF